MNRNILCKVNSKGLFTLVFSKGSNHEFYTFNSFTMLIGSRSPISLRPSGPVKFYHVALASSFSIFQTSYLKSSELSWDPYPFSYPGSHSWPRGVGTFLYPHFIKHGYSTLSILSDFTSDTNCL